VHGRSPDDAHYRELGRPGVRDRRRGQHHPVRTPIEDPKEITILFLLMGLGMLCGIGAFSVAGLATAFVAVFLVALDYFAPSSRGR